MNNIKHYKNEKIPKNSKQIYILVSVFEGNDLYFNSTFKEYFDEDFSKCSHGIENFIHIKTISLPGNHAFSEIQIQLNEKKFKFSHLSRPSLQLKKLIEFHIEQLGIKSFAEEPSMRNKSDNDDECRINFFAWMAETDPDKTVNISADYNHKGQEYRFYANFKERRNKSLHWVGYENIRNIEDANFFSTRTIFPKNENLRLVKDPKISKIIRYKKLQKTFFSKYNRTNLHPKKILEHIKKNPIELIYEKNI